MQLTKFYSRVFIVIKTCYNALSHLIENHLKIFIHIVDMFLLKLSTAKVYAFQYLIKAAMRIAKTHA